MLENRLGAMWQQWLMLKLNNDKDGSFSSCSSVKHGLGYMSVCIGNSTNLQKWWFHMTITATSHPAGGSITAWKKTTLELDQCHSDTRTGQITYCSQCAGLVKQLGLEGSQSVDFTSLMNAAADVKTHNNNFLFLLQCLIKNVNRT